MSNPIMENYTYNLTKIFSADMIEDPTLWLANFNMEMGSIVVPVLMVLIGLVLYVVMKETGTTDSEALLYAGIIISLIGVFAFIIDITTLPGVKILTWIQLVPFIIFTAIMVFVNHANQQY